MIMGANVGRIFEGGSPRTVDRIIAHCSASDLEGDDSLLAIARLHTRPTTEELFWGPNKVFGFGWKYVGYHYVITKNGMIHKGRPDHVIGAHTYGYNRSSIGICVTGDKEFTDEQRASFKGLVGTLMEERGLNITDVYPHNYFNKNKTCPNFDVMEWLI